jgi:hypothetical protein
VGAALALAALGMSSSPRPASAAEPDRRADARDWKRYPAVVELDTSEDVFALGDVHGDYDRLVALLVAGRIIPEAPASPERVAWGAGKAVLVCTGDLIDKGKHSLKVIALFRALRSAAADAGGRVVVTMGNHEAEFLADPTATKVGEFARELTDHDLRPEGVAAGRDPRGVGLFLRSLPFAARVNDWFFVHAGNTHGRTLKELRSDLEEGVNAQGYKAPVLQDPDSLLEARLHKPRPWWERDGDTPADSRARLAKLVQALGVKHLVMGHQPGKVTFSDGTGRHKGQMVQKFDGLIFLIDVGMSAAIDDSEGALLHIQGGRQPRAVAIYPGGKPPVQLWPES